MQIFAFPVMFTSLDAASALYNEPDMIWLDSNKADHPQSKYSYICFQSSEPMKSYYPEHITDLPPFQGGYAGFRSYEGEDFFKFYSQILSFNHHTGQGWFVTHCNDEAEANHLYNDVCAKVRTAKPVPEFHPCLLNWTSNFSKEAYQNAVQRIIECILNGDIFQANLTQKFSADRPHGFNSFSHYLRLRDINPAPYAAYINWGDVQILSASPESFLSLSHDGYVITRPIKGTDDNAERLAASIKDRAENVMIVDLLRNDLSKVCVDETVRVERLCELQSFAGLYHLVSEVSGKLLPTLSAQHLLDACFPGGSITGAPKTKAMDIIRGIEKTSRGVYCGSIGWMGMDGAMDMNIAIRTVTSTPDTISFGVGGGITALSNPESEYQETLLKAQNIFKSYEGQIS